MENSDILSKAGLKVTKPRRIVLNILKKTDKVLNVSEIHEICKEENFDINLSTIYRICEKFVSKNILDKVVSSDRISGYKISIKTHIHKLNCSLCKKIVEVNCPFNILSQYIESSTGFTLTKHSIDISGICYECKNKN